MQNIRNFCIIAHIDHGKSTLADRFLEITQTVPKRKMREQYLDQMDLERERGITIKLQPVRMEYILNSKFYILNLIDTPGHVDFNYEVSRSLACCEGAILLVDATQGIQAQTIANLYLALEQNLEIIPVVNKIDLPAARPKEVAAEISHLLGGKREEIIFVSAKTGENVKKVLKAVIDRVPPPKEEKETRALIFDSVFDDYRGVVLYVRLRGGEIKKGDKIMLMSTGKTSECLEVGYFKPELQESGTLKAGEIGYLVTGWREIADARVGDTVTLAEKPASLALAGYRESKPMVFAGIYVKEGSDFAHLREAIGRFKLNDASLTYESENSPALGFGFRCGFLGLLHLDIVAERLKREYNLDLIVTTPSVAYRVYTTQNEEKIIRSPQELPDPSIIKKIEEPWMKTDIVTPKEYIGPIITLLNTKHSEPQDIEMEFLEENRVIIHYLIPLSEMVVDFYDKLKNVSSGFASMNYEFFTWREAKLRRLDILVAGEEVSSLATIVYEKEAYPRARTIVETLRKVLPRQLFEVKIQAALGGKIIASEKIPALRKDVTAKLYGGDVTRKRKLLEKQKKGKKKMAILGKVDIPPEAFLAVLKR